nr:MAG TPA: hypothetical protein [Bacteriophage sp.]
MIDRFLLSIIHLQLPLDTINIRKEVRINHMFGLILLLMKMECMTVLYLTHLF